MRDEVLSIVRGVNDPAQAQNILREYLQAFVLRSLHESEAFRQLSFVGGTALRFCFELPRFSEDLDFSLEQVENYDPVTWLAKLKKDLLYSSYDATITWNDRKTVHTAWVKLAGILHQAGLSSLPKQKLSIKLDTIDIDAVRSDVAPFLERPADVRLISREHVRTALQIPECLPDDRETG